MPAEQDVFVNQAYLKVIESAANTLTFNQLLTNVSIHEKIGWVISRMDYKFAVSSTVFAASLDLVEFGLSVSDQLAAIGMEYSGVIDWFVKGTALESVMTIEARMFYTVKKLKVEDFWELVEMRRMIGV